MSGFGFEKRGKSRVKKFGLLLTLPFIILIIAYVVYKLFLIPEPIIKGTEAFNLLPLDKTIILDGKNLQSIYISISQGDKTVQLLKDFPKNGEKIYKLQIKPKDLGLTDGVAIVNIKARSGFIKEMEYKINARIDTIPPAIEVLNAPFTVYQGSAGFAVFRAKDADSVFVKLGDYAFKAFKSASKSDSALKRGAVTYLAFFPVPLGIKEGSVFYAIAEDIAGNQNVKALRTRLKTKRYKSSTINIDNSFINLVVSPLLNEMDISNPIRAFKIVNEEWREKSLRRLREIAQETEPEIFWKGRFLQLKNSKVMATYGDKRTYYYEGEPAGESVHLGYDLASVANAPVEAANTGVVKFVGELGIYGNAIIIDHGLGLMSLYGHLSETMVREGEAVKKGALIGRTGSTGLAGGDHLHFGILIHGYEVSPLYWWDSHWLKANVLDSLEQYYDMY